MGRGHTRPLIWVRRVWFRTSVVHADTLDLSIMSFLLDFNVCVCVCVCVYAHMHRYALPPMLTLKYLCIFMLYLCFTPATPLLIYATAVILFHLYIFMYTPDLLVLYSYFSCCACVCVPAYWPSRVCGAKWGAGERWSMWACRLAAEASSSSTATRSGSCLCTDACRYWAGTYSSAGVIACVNCDSGKRCMSYDALLPNLVSVRIPEEDARREYV